MCAVMPDDEINITSRPEGARGKRMTAADERIAELEAREKSTIEALCKIATGKIGDEWATDKIKWRLCRTIAVNALSDLGVSVSKYDQR